MSMLPIEEKVYDDGRTKQSFGDSTDINKILNKAQISGTVSHLSKYGAEYGDFSDFDFFEAQQGLARAGEIFDALPAEMRKEFDHKPSKYFEFVNDPANRDQLERVLPQIAEPGRFFPDVIGRGLDDTPPETPPEPVGGEEEVVVE